MPGPGRGAGGGGGGGATGISNACGGAGFGAAGWTAGRAGSDVAAPAIPSRSVTRALGSAARTCSARLRANCM